MKNTLSLLKSNFMGQSPTWYKLTIVAFLIVNPIIFHFDPFIAGWAVLIQFIFTLACALKCYPLQPGGLIAIQALIIGLTNAKTVWHEVTDNVPTLFLLIFMIAGIYFIKDVIFVVFTKLFLSIKSKPLLSLAFCSICACLAAFLGLITLAAITVAVSFNFYAIYHRATNRSNVDNEKEFEEFRGFLRNLVIHGAVGSTIGGTLTMVGEPQNLMIATKMGWTFTDFFTHNHIISIPVAISAFILCFSLEFFKVPGFGHQMPERARELIMKDYKKKIQEMTEQNVYIYAVQIIAGIMLAFSLAFSVAQVGLLGIGLIIVVTAFTGRTQEHDLAEAFNNAMPFTMLIVTFFVILGVVHDQGLITPLAQWVFTFSGKAQQIALFFTNGVLSFVSDNVFVASVFISEVDNAYNAGTFPRDWYEKLGVVINMGTNIPAIATPNGQAGFLFILTSSLASLIGLSYFKMFKLVLPYTLVMTTIGALSIYFFL